MGTVYGIRRKAGHTPDDIYNSSSDALRRGFKQEYEADKAVERSNEEYGDQRVAAATLANERALAQEKAEAALAPREQAPDVSMGAATKSTDSSGQPTDSSGQPTKRRAKFNTQQSMQAVRI